MFPGATPPLHWARRVKGITTDLRYQARKPADVLLGEGFRLVSGGTDNHLMLIDLAPLGLTGKIAGELLEKKGIIVNKNTIPFDTRKPWDPSGIRLGTPAVTTQGMKEKDMIKIARKINEALSLCL
jgi:glycine hydroxymethyltransferase